MATLVGTCCDLVTVRIFVLLISDVLRVLVDGIKAVTRIHISKKVATRTHSRLRLDECGHTKMMNTFTG